MGMYVFHGSDTYESYTAAKKQINKFSKEQNIPFKVIDGDELLSLDQLLAELETVSMFSSSNLLFVKRVFTNKRITKTISDHIEALNKYDIVFWEDSKLDGRTELTKKLKKTVSVKEFTELKPRQLSEWADKVASAKGIMLSKKQVDLIVERSNEDKWIIVGALKKLYQYINISGNDSFNDDLLENLLGYNVNGDIWKLLDAFGAKNTKALFSEYKKLTTYDRNVQYLIAMVTRELSLLSTVLSLEGKQVSAKELGLHPFVLENTKKKAKRFSFGEVTEYLRSLMKADFSAKQGRAEEHVTMTLFLSSIQ